MLQRAKIFFLKTGTDIRLIAIGILPFLFTTTLLFLKNPLPWPDEAIFLNTAQTLQKTGILATSLFGNAIYGLDKHALWYPPLYFYLLSYWTLLLGSSIEAIRTLSVLLSIVCLFVFFYLLKRLFTTNRLALWGTLLLAADSGFSQAGRVARMDMLSFFFLVTALYSYFVALKKHTAFYLVPGLISALAVLTHPLGFIAPTTIVFHVLISGILFREKAKKILVFALPIILTQLAWILSIKHDLELLTIQYGLQIARKAGEIPFAIIFFRENFVWEIIFICYLVIVGMFINNQIFKNRTQESIFFLFGFLLSVFALMGGKEGWYLLYFQPFIILIYLSLFQHMHQATTTLYKFSLTSIGIVLFCMNIFLSFSQASNFGDYHAFTSMIKHVLPEEASVFLSTIPDPYFDLVKNTHLTLFEFPTVPISDTAYFNLLDKSDYIIINFAPSEEITQYIMLNKTSTDTVIQSGDYDTQIIKLLPRNRRKRAI